MAVPRPTARSPHRPQVLTERLNRIGVTSDARVAAFHDLATQIPRPVLADLIGYNPNFLAERAITLGTSWQHDAALRAARASASNDTPSYLI